MRHNPRSDWQIADFKSLAKHFDIAWRASGGSHVVFVAPNGGVVTVPALRPIKPAYVKMFVEMIDRVRSTS